MPTISYLFVMSSLAVSLVSGCARHTEDGATAPRRRVAVAHLEVPTALVLPDWFRLETPLLHDDIIQALVQSNAVDVVERTRFDKILGEQKLTRDDLTAPDEAARLGKLLGADYFLIGSLTTAVVGDGTRRVPYTQGVERTQSGEVGIAFRLVDVETGRVAVAGNAGVLERAHPAGIADDGDARHHWQELAREAAADVAAQVLDAIAPVTIVKVHGDDVELSRGVGVRAGDDLEVLALDDNGGAAGRRRAVGRVQVTGADQHGASARVTRGADVIRSGMPCRPLPPAPPPAAPTPVDPLDGRW